MAGAARDTGVPGATGVRPQVCADPDAVRATEDRASAAWTGTPGEVMFYRLTKKFVESSESISDEAQQVMYYTLAIGHHTGVIDCFEPALGCTRELYDAVVALFPAGSEARYKLEGIERFGEIQIDKTHVGVLLPAIDGVLERLGWRGSDRAGIDVRDDAFAEHVQELSWLTHFRDLLEEVRDETALYLTGRGK